MLVFASILGIMLLVSEGSEAHAQKDGSMFLVGMQAVAFAAACIFPMKETAIFFLCSVLVSMFKFYIVDVSRDNR